MNSVVKNLLIAALPLSVASVAHAGYPVGYPGGGYGIPLSNYQEIILGTTSVTLTDEGGTGSWNDAFG